MTDLLKKHEDDIAWWARRDYEGEMGRRSNAMSLVEFGERGVFLSTPRIPKTISEKACAAVRRLDAIEARMAQRCSVLEERILRAAFCDGNATKLAAYGEWPLAATRCSVTVELQSKARPGMTPLHFLEQLAKTAVDGPRAERRFARIAVRKIRERTEGCVRAALAKYCGETRPVPDVPPVVSLRDLARVLKMEPRTVAARLKARNLVPVRDHSKWFVPTAELPTCYPEAWKALATPEPTT